MAALGLAASVAGETSLAVVPVGASVAKASHAKAKTKKKQPPITTCTAVAARYSVSGTAVEVTGNLPTRKVGNYYSIAVNLTTGGGPVIIDTDTRPSVVSFNRTLHLSKPGDPIANVLVGVDHVFCTAVET